MGWVYFRRRAWPVSSEFEGQGTDSFCKSEIPEVIDSVSYGAALLGQADIGCRTPKMLLPDQLIASRKPYRPHGAGLC